MNTTDEQDFMGSDTQDSELPATPGALDPKQQELIDLLRNEVAEIISICETTMDEVKKNPDDTGKWATLTTNYADQIENIGKAAEIVGLYGLQSACEFFTHNFVAIAEQNQPYTGAQLELAERWSIMLLGYLQYIYKPESTSALIEFMQLNDWINPLDDEDADLLGQSLRAPVVSDLQEGQEPRKVEATPEDVSLLIPEDVNQELLQTVMRELPGQTAQFTESIENLIRHNDISQLEAARRIAHTVKGAGNLVGIAGIANLTHHAEDILEALYKSGALPNSSLRDVLLNTADCLELMLEFVLGVSEPPEDALSVLQDVINWANHINDHGVPEEDLAGPSSSAPKSSEETVAEPLISDLPDDLLDTNSLTENTGIESEYSAAAPVEDNAADQIQDQQPVVAQSEVVTQDAGPDTAEPQTQTNELPESATHDTQGQAAPAMAANSDISSSIAEGILRLTGETLITAGQIEDRVKQVSQAIAFMNKQNKQLKKYISDLEEQIIVKGFMRPTQTSGDEFDSIEFDQYNEVHSLSHQIQESCADAGEMINNLDREFHWLSEKCLSQVRLNRESRELALKTQMVAAATVTSRLKRNVRQVARLTDKDAQLTIEGGDVLLDNRVLEKIIDPLMHLIRNAIDHGIETPEDRIAAGKPGKGDIKIAFRNTGEHVVITCEDDGAGLNVDDIKQKAIAQGLIQEYQSLSEQEILNLVLTAGFSTRDKVSQISGRGIGMDVVNTTIKEVKGTMSITSDPGKGTIIELVLPTLLALSNALLLRVHKSVFAATSVGIEQILFAGIGAVRQNGTELIYQIENKVYPAYRLETLLALPVRNTKIREDQLVPLLTKDDNDTEIIVLTEEVLDSRGLVIMPLGDAVPKIRGITGASILSDGNTTAVLDLQELVSDADAATTVAASYSTDLIELEEEESSSYAMVVDDSLSARQSLSQFIHDIGFEVKTAKDGVEAIELIEKQTPSIILTDLEMPRMNGVELSHHIKSAKRYGNIPIVMITSRSAEKHKKLALDAGVDVYLVKPYSENQLLDSIEKLLMSETDLATSIS